MCWAQSPRQKEILDIPVYQGGSDFPESHDIELRNVRFSYDSKTDVLQGVNLKIRDGERMALVGAVRCRQRAPSLNWFPGSMMCRRARC